MPGVTYLSSLPELDALQTSHSHPASHGGYTDGHPSSGPGGFNYGGGSVETWRPDTPNLSKYIRTSHNRPVQENYDNIPRGPTNEVAGGVRIGAGGYHQRPEMEDLDDGGYLDDETGLYSSPEEEQTQDVQCKGCYDHIQNCPVCKSFYTAGASSSSSSTVGFVSIIIALILIIALMGKKLYDLKIKQFKRAPRKP
jgi:hypothetical protein